MVYKTKRESVKLINNVKYFSVTLLLFFVYTSCLHLFLSTGLGGCIRRLTIRSDERSSSVTETVDLAVTSRRSVRVYLDGCPTSESRFNCRGNDSVLVYSGSQTQATDYSLQPFTGNRAQNAVHVQYKNTETF